MCGVANARAGNDRASVKKGCELLLKILGAILAQPEEEKFRKIRTENKAFGKLLGLAGE